VSVHVTCAGVIRSWVGLSNSKVQKEERRIKRRWEGGGGGGRRVSFFYFDFTIDLSFSVGVGWDVCVWCVCVCVWCVVYALVWRMVVV